MCTHNASYINLRPRNILIVVVVAASQDGLFGFSGRCLRCAHPQGLALDDAAWQHMKCFDPQKTIVPCRKFLERCITAGLRLPIPRLDLTVRVLHKDLRTVSHVPAALCEHGYEWLAAIG